MAVIKDFDTEKTILKYFDCKAFAAKLPTSLGVLDNTTGLTIIKAGTPYPANDATCEGIVLHDYDVTNGPVEGAVVYAGAIDYNKILANNLTVASAAKAVLPRIVFFDYQ